jgi:hypothetical protein
MPQPTDSSIPFPSTPPTMRVMPRPPASMGAIPFAQATPYPSQPSIVAAPYQPPPLNMPPAGWSGVDPQSPAFAAFYNPPSGSITEPWMPPPPMELSFGGPGGAVAPGLREPSGPVGPDRQRPLAYYVTLFDSSWGTPPARDPGDTLVWTDNLDEGLRSVPTLP